MQISNYNQVLEVKDLIYNKMVTCHRVGVIASFNFDLSIDSRQFTIQAAVNKYEFAQTSHEWKANVYLDPETSLENTYNEEEFNELNDYLDNLLAEKVKQVMEENKVLNAYFGK